LERSEFQIQKRDLARARAKFKNTSKNAAVLDYFYKFKHLKTTEISSFYSFNYIKKGKGMSNK
jgi:hypothetical protein